MHDAAWIGTGRSLRMTCRPDGGAAAGLSFSKQGGHRRGSGMLFCFLFVTVSARLTGAIGSAQLDFWEDDLDIVANSSDLFVPRDRQARHDDRSDYRGLLVLLRVTAAPRPRSQNGPLGPQHRASQQYAFRDRGYTLVLVMGWTIDPLNQVAPSTQTETAIPTASSPWGR